MIKEFEPPFFYKTPSIIEENIKSASSNLIQDKLAFFIIFMIFNGYYAISFIINRNLLFLECLIFSSVIFCLLFYLKS